MSNVYVVAYHQSAFGKLFELTLEQMLARATAGVLEAAGAEATEVDTVCVAGCCAPLLNQQMLLAGLCAQIPGLRGKPIDTAENACASGGQAVLNVVHRLMAGVADVGLALGVEKMRDAAGKADGKLIGQVLGIASHPAERAGKQFVFPHIFAELMARYIAEHGSSERELAHVPVVHYGHAAHNPLAQMRSASVTLDDVLRIEGINRYVVPGLPLKTYECSQISDGYAALLLCNDRGLARLGKRRGDVVELAGHAQRTDPLATVGRDDLLRPAGARAAVESAYAMAGIGARQISVAEVHDCFGVMGAMAVELLGKAEPGRGARFYAEGRATVGGECPVNTSGGLIGKGHPIGATGVAMPGWCFQQLMGTAPTPLQVPSIDHAATFNIGGPICATVAMVLRRPS